jgi:hypothetical protein
VQQPDGATDLEFAQAHIQLGDGEGVLDKGHPIGHGRR